jgi:glycosyltransferase involved in cell wall biosynthesis
MVAAGHRVEVLALADGRSAAAAADDGVALASLGSAKYRGSSRLAYIGAYLAFTFRAWLAITRRVLGRGVELVYVNNPPDFLVFAAIAARMRAVPVVLDVHDMSSDLYGAKFGGGRGILRRLIGQVERMSFRFADGLVTIHDVYRDRIAAIVTPGTPVGSVWNVPDASGWTAIGDARAESEGGSRDRPLRLGHHGTIVDRFGVDAAVEAVARLRDRGMTVSLAILGDGDFADRLSERIEELGVGDRVRFERRTFVPDDLPAFVGGIDVGVAPYRPSSFMHQVLPTKVLEYLALGVPAIVTETEMVRRHLDGAVRIISGESVAELADAIAEMADPATRRRYQLAGRPLAHEYDWETQRSALLALLASVLPANDA